ncbi:MAG: cbb3-type cytochrome c oxidase subunit I [Chloroflexi bacterium]|nr:cbb3-type cytochrome c oxidase subunit I [Chloroflexota bacterium]
MAVASPATTAPAGLERDYLRDPLLGFAIHRPTRRFILAFFTTAYIVLGLGALAALLVVLTRAPAIKLLAPDSYYQWLTFHGVLMLTMFPHLFEGGLWMYTSTVLLRTRPYSLKLGWISFGVAAAGIAMILGSIASGEATVLYTTYVPLRAYPLFYVGHMVYAVGLLGVLTLFALNIVKARMDGRYVGSLPLATYGMVTSAIIGLVAIISALVAFIPATLWAFRFLDLKVDPLTFKAAFWGMGHTLQYTNVTGMVVAWYIVASFALLARPVSEKFSRYAFALYLLTTVPVFAHHLLVDPTWTPGFKWFGATFVGIILGIASMSHGIAVPASVEAAVRRQRGGKGTFGFLAKWGWKEPGMVLLFASFVLFGFGGFDGTIATVSQLNMILHNTMWIPAHIHGALAGGLAVAFMAVSYYILPSLGVRIRGARTLGVVQAYVTSIGFVAMIIGLHVAAEQGVPRRTQDIAYEAAKAAGTPIPDWFGAMNFTAIGGSMAGTGVLLFVGIMLWSLWASRNDKQETYDERIVEGPVSVAAGNGKTVR